MKRRNFLKNSALVSTASLIPQFLKSSSLMKVAGGSRSEKILIVIQLSGGNDGLNTIVPFQNDIYYQKRNSLAINQTEVLKVSDDLGFNPSMTALQSLYDEGLVSIVNSVGYPNPDRSHFRSMDIWQTGSSAKEHWTTGWLGRYLDNACNGCQVPHAALEVSNQVSLSLKGIENTGFAMSKPAQLKRAANHPFLKSLAQEDHHHEENVAYLYKTLINTQESADYLFQKSKTHRVKNQFPDTPFGKDLKQIAELITADSETQIYYVTLGGFDTHARQKGTQNRLLQQYSEGVKALTEALKSNGLLKDTLIMTFSEFGRRVGQNASGGTDHGTANNLFLIGGNLKKPGFFNDAPNLMDLDNGDLKYQIDFRQVYATVLDNWLQADSKAVLKERFGGLGLV